MKALRMSVLLVLLLTVAACAATTGYGKEPEQLGPDTYSFTVYFNAFASPADAEKKVERYAAEFMPKHGYTSYDIENRNCDSGRGKCQFKIRFKK